MSVRDSQGNILDRVTIPVEGAAPFPQLGPHIPPAFLPQLQATVPATDGFVGVAESAGAAVIRPITAGTITRSLGGRTVTLSVEMAEGLEVIPPGVRVLLPQGHGLDTLRIEMASREALPSAAPAPRAGFTYGAWTLEIEAGAGGRGVVCLPYDVESVLAPILYRNANGRWEPLATQRITTAGGERVVCAPTRFSVFAVLYPQNNGAPVADAGEDQVVAEGATVQLDGRGRDPEGEVPLSYAWRQTSGIPVTLIGADTAQPTFTMPEDLTTPLRFILTVTDPRGEDSAQDEVQVTTRAAAGETRTRAAAQWLARFGRSTAEAAVDVIGGRFGTRAGESYVKLGGQRLALSSGDKAGSDLTGVLAQVVGALGLPTTSGQPTSTPGYDPGWHDPRFQALTARQTGLTLPSGRQWLGNSGFQLSLTGNGAGEPGPWTVWGQGHFTRFEGQEGETLDVEGTVSAGYLGVDYRWAPNSVAGVAVSHTYGDGDLTEDDVTGDLESTLTSVYPYAQWAPSEGLGVWGLLGYGWGEMELTQPNSQLTTDLEMRMAAVGAQGDLPSVMGLELALKADGFLVEVESENVEDLPGVEANAQRLRLALAGERPWVLGETTRLVPSIEIGGRYDGGDAEEGLGAEIGGGLVYTNTALGLDVAARGRYLVAHEDEDFERWSASLTARLQPPDGSGEGLSFSLAPSWGSTASGVDALWGSAAGGLVNQVGQGAATGPGPDRMEFAVGYGVGLWSGRGLVTPFGELGLTQAGTQRLRVGTRLAMRDTGLGVAVFGERRAQADTQQDYLLGFTASWQF